MKKKKTTKKAKKITISIAARDYEKLTLLAKSQHSSRPVVARRLIKSQLALVTMEKQAKNAENQLGLFDTLQLDILGGVGKA